MVLQACNPNTLEMRVGGSWVQSEPELHSKTVTNTNDNERLKAFYKTLKTKCETRGPGHRSLDNSLLLVSVLQWDEIWNPGKKTMWLHYEDGPQLPGWWCSSCNVQKGREGAKLKGGGKTVFGGSCRVVDLTAAAVAQPLLQTSLRYWKTAPQTPAPKTD
jgi:hypothetical protein